MRKPQVFRTNFWRFRRHHVWRPVVLLAVLLGMIVAGSDGEQLLDRSVRAVGGSGWGEPRITCAYPRIIDGDTLECGGRRIRLAGIDAPEMPGHCRRGRDCTPGDPYAAQAYLRSIAQGEVNCRPTDTDAYGRTVARCGAAGRDFSCAMIAAGHAVRRYGNILCLFCTRRSDRHQPRRHGLDSVDFRIGEGKPQMPVLAGAEEGAGEREQAGLCGEFFRRL